MPETTEECTIACWPKKMMDEMSKQISVVHDFVIEEQAVKKERDRARDELHKMVKTGAVVISISLALLSGLWAVFKIVSPTAIVPHAEAHINDKANK